MSRKCVGVVFGGRYYHLPEEEEALAAARGGAGSTRHSAIGVYSEKRALKSRSLGCHRNQADMLNQTIKQHGITGVRYVPGRHGCDCQLTEERGAEKWMKIYGEMHGVGPLHNAGSEGVE
jgi:hypothetical protein